MRKLVISGVDKFYRDASGLGKQFYVEFMRITGLKRRLMSDGGVSHVAGLPNLLEVFSAADGVRGDRLNSGQMRKVLDSVLAGLSKRKTFVVTGMGRGEFFACVPYQGGDWVCSGGKISKWGVAKLVKARDLERIVGSCVRVRVRVRVCVCVYVCVCVCVCVSLSRVLFCFIFSDISVRS